MIAFDQSDLADWLRLLKEAPEFIQAASAAVLNNQGFKLRQLQGEELQRLMIIRNPGMVKRFLTVIKTSNFKPISEQEVRVGSLRSNTFSGWAESEAGGPSERAKLILLMARGGDPRKVVPKANRITSAQSVIHAHEFSLGSSERNQTIGLMIMLARQNYKGLFQLDGKFGGGIYRIKSVGLRRGKRGGRRFVPVVQKIQQPGKHMMDTAKHWNALAAKALLAGSSFGEEWKAGLAHAIELAKRKHPKL